MPQYKVLSPVSCGQIFKIGDTIPDGTLSDRDATALIKCGAIEELQSAIAERSSQGAEETSAHATAPERTSRAPHQTLPHVSSEISAPVFSTTANPAPPKTNPPPVVSTGVISDPTKILDYVNSADQAGLERIKKVGTSTAKAMISHGKFASIDELKELVGNVDWDEIEIV